jgi:cytoskeleton protein RodZ
MMFPSSFGRNAPPEGNVGEFGDRFRKAREKKELSLDDVSNVTKISARMLRAIEEEHFDQLPGGVFNKGFIRAYAKHLGLDPEEAVTDYLACLRQAQIDAQEVWEPAPAGKPGSTQPFAGPERRRTVEPTKPAVKAPSPAQVGELPGLQLPRAEHVASQKEFALKPEREVPWSILAIAAIVVALAVVLWIRRSHTGAAGTPTAVKSAPSTIAPSVPVPDPAPPVNQASNPAPAKNSATPATSNSHPPQTAPTSQNANRASTATPAASNTTSASGDDANNDVTTRNLTKPVPPPAKSAAASLTLVIRAQETSWISVQADGQPVSQETLIAPAHTSVHASREIVAKIGNAAGVTFLWNGREVPADGAEAEVKTFIFDANGMRVLPTTQPASNH